jgi:hypothetical protein
VFIGLYDKYFSEFRTKQDNTRRGVGWFLVFMGVITKTMLGGAVNLYGQYNVCYNSFMRCRQKGVFVRQRKSVGERGLV